MGWSAVNRAVSIVGIPSDEHSSWATGCALAPPAIRKAFLSPASNTWCEAGFDLRDDSRICDEGDLQPGSGESARHQIEQSIRELHDQGRIVLALGGDHAITLPILRGTATPDAPVDVLHLDAHPDLYDELDGNRYSHATPMRRALEEGLIGRLVQVGIRTMNGSQRDQAERFGVEVITMGQFSPDIELSFDRPLYLSLDLDVLDPAFVPGVSHYEPGGMTTRELIALIQRLDDRLIGADIVELNPRRDIQGVTATVAAKLMKEILARMIA